MAALVEWYNASKELAEKKGTEIEGSHGLVYASSISVKIYEALGNYLLSKSLAKIIDPHVQVLIMRGKIYSIQDYLMDMWENYQRFIRFIKPIDLSKPDADIPIGVDNKNARYRGY